MDQWMGREHGSLAKPEVLRMQAAFQVVAPVSGMHIVEPDMEGRNGRLRLVPVHCSEAQVIESCFAALLTGSHVVNPLTEIRGAAPAAGIRLAPPAAGFPSALRIASHIVALAVLGVPILMQPYWPSETCRVGK